uniref:Uncharacterized protein n=1 Tax=Rhizophora mucronata TaxID=61149 RepID=A0A2P2Q0X9_RHIMU
MVCQLFVIVD